MKVDTTPVRPRMDRGAPPRTARFPRAPSGGAWLLTIAALLTALPFAATSAEFVAAASGGGCAPGALTLAHMETAAPSGPGSSKTPADAVIEDGYGFVMLGTVGTRFWPDKGAKLDSVMQAGDRADALCKIKTADGTSWLVLRSAGGTLRYVPTVGTVPVTTHDADMSRMRKIWAAEIGRRGEKPRAAGIP